MRAGPAGWMFVAPALIVIGLFFALPVASGVLSRVARFRRRGLVPGRGRRF